MNTVNIKIELLRAGVPNTEIATRAGVSDSAVTRTIQHRSPNEKVRREIG